MPMGTWARAFGRGAVVVGRLSTPVTWKVVGWVALAMGFAGCGETPGGFEPGSHEAAESPPSEVSSNPPPDILSQTVHSLVRQGWSEKPAWVVAQFNRRLLEVAWDTDRAQWQKIVNLWGRLGTRPRLQRVVERMPEFASLLAGALEAREDAGDAIAQSIPNDSESRQIVSHLYGMFPEASDAVMWPTPCNAIET